MRLCLLSEMFEFLFEEESGAGFWAFGDWPFAALAGMSRGISMGFGAKGVLIESAKGSMETDPPEEFFGE